MSGLQETNAVIYTGDLQIIPLKFSLCMSRTFRPKDHPLRINVAVFKSPGLENIFKL